MDLDRVWRRCVFKKREAGVKPGRHRCRNRATIETEDGRRFCSECFKQVERERKSA